MNELMKDLKIQNIDGNDDARKLLEEIKFNKANPTIIEKKFNCLNIVPLDDGAVNEDTSETNVIFKHPFYAVFLGPSRSGKTTTWLNVLKNKDLLYGKFEEILYFIPTWYDDPIYDQELDVDPSDVFIDYNPRFLKKKIDLLKNLTYLI